MDLLSGLHAQPPGRTDHDRSSCDAVGDDADRKTVAHERAELREFVTGLSPDDVRSGDWFSKLSTQALSSYTNTVNWQYVQERYEDLPADAIVDIRIKMAARYAALEAGSLPATTR
ncbi:MULTISPECIES: hypothetical protein [Streptomyces]|uniref:Uncharacterized protein n=1 Tax=Streptomyces pseudovenezuelae TaxID=67350 RepID=A0A117PPF6_9ACTN|nr:MULTISPECIES: hypothetical protein [Streptomyces]KUM84291.1 hypothetical protein AQI94_32380 [Streptomyces pseudovenezuelae]